MHCPSDSNRGFIKIQDTVEKISLDNITINSNPLSVAFSPRSIVPKLYDNRINESPESNTCIYKGNKFNLVDVQICSVVHTGYTIPSISQNKTALSTKNAVAELMITFKSVGNNNLSNISNIILCLPIYDSGIVSRAQYITQLLESSSPSCTPDTFIKNAAYSGKVYDKQNVKTLNKCISAACNDPKVLAYTFYPNMTSNHNVNIKGVCKLFDNIPPVKRHMYEDKDEDYAISGTINHNVPNTGSCNITNGKVATLESLFSETKDDPLQTSLAYKSCFMINYGKTRVPSNFYIIVFPNGIHLQSSQFQQLLIQFNGSLKEYRPPDSKQIEGKISHKAFSESISAASDNFKVRFEYFKLPPRMSSRKPVTESEYYKTSEYKCMPFDQLKDVSTIKSDVYVIPGSNTLDNILNKNQPSTSSISTGDWFQNTSNTDKADTAIAWTVTIIAGLLLSGVVYKLGK